MTIKQKQRTHLQFRAVVQNGEGAFNKMRFPGRTEMLESPLCLDGAENFKPSKDWPEDLCPGSMNCRIIEFPKNFAEVVGEGDRIAALDTTQTFIPEFCIPKDAIENNRVGHFPNPDRPRMGIAQAWKCVVTNERTGEKFDAWHVRRVDGTYPPFHGIIELMSDKRMRDVYGLENGTEIAIDMYSAEPE